VGEVTNALSKALLETTAFPSKVLFFTSKAAAQNYINASGGAVSPPLQKIASGGQAVANTATGSVDDFLEFPEKILGWISNRANIVRVVKVIVGGVMVLTGLNMLVKDTTNIDVAGSVKNAAGNVAKIGTVA
jgi:hypothetical protein